MSSPIVEDTRTSFNPELVAPCGIYCSLCSGYLAMQHNLKNKGIRMTYCAGCRPRDKKCAFLKKKCQRLLNHTVQFCYECPTYPCTPLTHLDTRYRTFFHLSLLENLSSLKKNGIDAFLRSQEQTWRCPTCGGTICCHNGLCFLCDLERLRHKKQPYRWDHE